MDDLFVPKTLAGLKKRLNDHKLVVQNAFGFVAEVSFQFEEPALENEIQEFSQRTGLQLPKDYVAFLKIHNGANLFQAWFGGQFELYGLHDIEKQKKAGLFLEPWYPIGYQDGGYLLIDGEKTSKGEKDYLLWWESSIVEDAKKLNLNFEHWLDRFIICQGTKFWDWT